MSLWDINPHLALGQSESYSSPGEIAWDRFVSRVERLIGRDLDGDQERDGYSIDCAYAAFEAGETADSYALEAKAAIAERGANA
jgi:hypothetical protein